MQWHRHTQSLCAKVQFNFHIFNINALMRCAFSQAPNKEEPSSSSNCNTLSFNHETKSIIRWWCSLLRLMVNGNEANSTDNLHVAGPFVHWQITAVNGDAWNGCSQKTEEQSGAMGSAAAAAAAIWKWSMEARRAHTDGQCTSSATAAAFWRNSQLFPLYFLSTCGEERMRRQRAKKRS